MLGLTVVILLPAYYLAKSKGYNVVRVLIFAAIVSTIPMVIRMLNDDLPFPFADFTFPLLVLFVIWLLPEREGAPGKKYLKITFDCPECKEGVIFPRSKEGKAELCPMCGEIIKVPFDEFSSKPSLPKRDKPNIVSGSVCYASFGDEMLAVQMQALFEDSGIESEVINGTGGGSLPQFSGTQGFKLSIDIKDWDNVVEIEKNANQPDPTRKTLAK